MKVFVAGATGVIGRSLVPMLVREGHEVVGITRSAPRTGLMRDLGAHGMVADAFDAKRLRTVVAETQPDVVIHQLTDIPKSFDPNDFDRHNKLRREGTRNLMDAAKAAGVPRVIAQSVAFMYARGGSELHEEADPLAVDLPDPGGDAVRAVAELEEAVTGTDGVDGLVLRYGYFYGPGTAYAADGAQGKMLINRRFPIVGNGDGVFSFIHVDDAATAAVRALDRGAPGIYNVVDDDPAPLREWLPELAKAIGAPEPRRVPTFVARMVGGRYVVQMLTRAQGASNAKAKAELDLDLRWPSWRRGFHEALG
ncbi:MAG TPA: NAD(P)-dependent oxidoreductase [Thermoleophilaceae bacterium]|nr:NAD(P)-dependent oxidoreductase [Thermoleophilaceae bacterium]